MVLTQKKSVFQHAFRAGALMLAAMLTTQSAQAFNAYQLGKNKWAIECNDGSLWSYSGSSAGLDIVGPELCKGHGGLAGPGGHSPIVVRPTGEIRRIVEGGCTEVIVPGVVRGKAGQCRAPGRAVTQQGAVR